MSTVVKLRYSDARARELQSKKSRKRQEREIICTDLNGNYIATFLNNMEASEKLKIPQCGISNVINGRLRQTRGFIFKIKSDPISFKQGDKHDTSDDINSGKEEK